MASLNLYNKYKDNKKKEQIRAQAKRQFDVREDEQIVIYEKKNTGIGIGRIILFLLLLCVLVFAVSIGVCLLSGHDIQFLILQLQTILKK